MKPATECGKTRKNKLGVLTCLGVGLIVLVANGCGGNAYNMTTSTPADNLPQTSAVTLTVTDAPPAGVTVLSFEVSINSAVLNPGNVQLITNPQRIEVKQLETDSAFLSTMNVPAGTYQSITVNVTNPELTVMNNSGTAIGCSWWSPLARPENTMSLRKLVKPSAKIVNTIPTTIWSRRSETVGYAMSSPASIPMSTANTTPAAAEPNEPAIALTYSTGRS